MDCKQKRMGIVGCFGQIENIKRQSLIYFRFNAAIYVLIGIGALVAQFTWSNNQEKEKEVLETMVHWTKIEEINDSTGVVSSYDILFPRTSEGVSSKFALVSEGGSTLLYRTSLTNLELTTYSGPRSASNSSLK